jgi:hypothetical protein
MMMKKIFISFMCILGLSLSIHAQQALDQLGVKKGAKFNGSLSATSNAYQAFGIPNRRNPFNWFVNGNFNFTVFGYSMPFSFSYSNQNLSYTQPFNRIQFAPSYKWAKLNVGTQSMTMSNYTLAGHVFNGVSTELSPGKFRLSAMNGILLKAVIFPVLTSASTKEDTLSYNNAVYERKGTALKLGYESNGNSYSMAILKATDIASSLPYVPATATITPKDNIAVSATIKQNLLKRFFVEVEYSLSSVNRNNKNNSNIEDSATVNKNLGKYNLLKGLLKPNNGTVYFDALQAGLGYTGNTFKVQLNYERVAPDFETLGAYNIVSDVRNITVAPNLQLFKGKVNIGANVGVQDNNLDQTKTSTNQRIVGSANINVTPNRHWNLAGNYNNFTNFTTVKPFNNPYAIRTPYDSLDFYQVNKSYGSNISFMFGKKEVPKSLMLNVNFQQANDQQKSATINQESFSDFLTANLGFTISKSKAGFSFTTAVNYYANEAAATKTTFVGPSMSLSKSLFQKRMRLSTNGSYSFTESVFNNTANKNAIANASLQMSFTPGKKPDAAAGTAKTAATTKKTKHALNASINFLHQPATAVKTKFSEVTINAGYSYSF